MSPFAYFVIVVTSLYIVYYAAMILHDLYAKKGIEKTTAEQIEIPDEESQTASADKPKKVGFAKRREEDTGEVIPEEEQPETTSYHNEENDMPQNSMWDITQTASTGKPQISEETHVASVDEEKPYPHSPAQKLTEVLENIAEPIQVTYSSSVTASEAASAFGKKRKRIGIPSPLITNLQDNV